MKHTSNLSGPEFNALFANLRDLDSYLAAEGSNKHERARLLINTCISGGIIAGTNIVGVLVKLGFDRKHVGIALKAGTHRAPEWPDWGRRDDGTYHVPPQPVTDE